MLLRKIGLLGLVGAACLSFSGCAHQSAAFVSLSYRYEGLDNCEGCPAFQVVFHTGGLVDFQGLRGCAVPGLQHYRIPETKFLELIRALHDGYFFDIPRLDTKNAWIDVDTITLAYKDERRVHETVDRNRQLPRLTQLEKQVREAAQVDRFLTPSVPLYQQLLASGWDVNTLGADHENAVTSAVDSQNLEAVRFLLEHGATVSKKALLDSAYSKSVDIVGLLLAARKTDMKSPEAKRLFVTGARSGEITRFLMKKGADANSRDPETGETPLIAAVGSSLDNVRFLLSIGADPNATDNSGHSALWRAVSTENSGYITILAEHGANVNAQDSDGRTPLMYASDLCWYWHIKALLAAGADPTIADKKGRTALQPELATSPDVPNCKTSRELLESAIHQRMAHK